MLDNPSEGHCEQTEGLRGNLALLFDHSPITIHHPALQRLPMRSALSAIQPVGAMLAFPFPAMVLWPRIRRTNGRCSPGTNSYFARLAWVRIVGTRRASPSFLYRTGIAHISRCVSYLPSLSRASKSIEL